MLGRRLYYEFYQQEVELKDLLGTAGGWTTVPRSGDTCGTSGRGSPGVCGGCSALPFGTSQLLEGSFTKTGTDPKHIVRNTIWFLFIFTVLS